MLAQGTVLRADSPLAGAAGAAIVGEVRPEAARGEGDGEFPEAPVAAAGRGEGVQSEANRALPEAPKATEPFSLKERFKLEARVTFGISAFLVPAAEAGFDMADPPSHFPKNWKDGPGAFGRNYGAELARHTAGGLARFTVAAVDREDPRYWASTDKRTVQRGWHAVLFTIANKRESGSRTLALSNLGGAAAAGLSGMPYEPGGYDDISHAGQRAAVEFASYGAHNLVTEFGPEIASFMRRAHLPEWMAKAVVSEDAVRP